MNLLDLSGKKALVIGTGGIGSAVAVGLAQYGADVAVADQDVASVVATVARIHECGGAAVACAVDVTDETAVRTLAAELADSWGAVDCLVNAFGLAARLPSLSLPIERLRQTIEVNTIGTFVCCRVFGEQMVESGGGKIVNISSVRGRYGAHAGMADYCASKGAVDALTRQLAVEWSSHRIHVNAIAPTVVETGFTAPILSNARATADLIERIPLGRWAQPEDLVGPVLFFLSPASDYVTGQILFVDGGLTAVV
jgi:NAD(P)-dependent dehydrogenase (short-subunit alcohol dehydrogenase family)